MRGSPAIHFDFEAVQARVINVIRKPRARAQVVQTAAADDAERNAGLAGNVAEQLPSLRRQFGRRGIRIEFRERAIEVEQ